YKGQDASQYRHYGPMAQEWFAAFGHDGVGLIGNDTSLSSADVDGIAYIAIQALERRTAELRETTEELGAKTRDVEVLKEELIALRTKISEMGKLQVEMAEIRSLLQKFTELQTASNNPATVKGHTSNRIGTKTTKPTGIAE
ncbi:MAG: hypothetical protein GXO82_00790, partial [Chlorobi bacterium]|nr:hypothetical protein [Chlorobiota bacterium]